MDPLKSLSIKSLSVKSLSIIVTALFVACSPPLPDEVPTPPGDGTPTDDTPDDEIPDEETPARAACAPGDSTPCKELAGLWASGTATCRESGTGWDVSSCTLADAGGRITQETVYPAQRDRGRWGNAVCNTGEDFAFQIHYPRLPGGARPTQWIIELQGGGMCFIEAPDSPYQCFRRATQKLGAADADDVPYPPDRTIRKTPMRTPPGFEGAIRVNAGYCSSDLWTGRNTTGVMMGHESYAPGEKRLWKFTGQINVEAMLDVLVERYGLDDGAPDLAIHFRGQSAGGAGVLANSFLMTKRFPNAFARRDLVASAWQFFFPPEWEEPGYPVFGEPSLRKAMDLALPIWRPGLMPACRAARADASDCINGVVLYDYIARAPAQGGLGLDLLIYFNRQDQLYMNMASIPLMSDTLSPGDREARRKYEHLASEGMGITVDGVPQPTPRVTWLFAPSDPQYKGEPNVHPPLTYQCNPPDGVENSLEAMTKRFWEGRHDRAFMEAGERHVYDVNYVTDAALSCP